MIDLLNVFETVTDLVNGNVVGIPVIVLVIVLVTDLL